MTANATSLSIISEGVSASRVSLHKLQHLVKRALNLVDSSEKKDHLYQVAGDIIGAIPDQLTEIERSLDKTLYALSVLGRDSLRSQIPLSDREAVDVVLESVTDPPEKPSPKRVAKRKLNDSDSGMGGAEDDFNLVGRNEVYGLAESGALSNTTSVAVKAVKEMDVSDVSVAKARSQAKKSPPDVDDIMGMKNSDELATLNRRLVEKVASRKMASNRFADSVIRSILNRINKVLNSEVGSQIFEYVTADGIPVENAIGAVVANADDILSRGPVGKAVDSIEAKVIYGLLEDTFQRSHFNGGDAVLLVDKFGVHRKGLDFQFKGQLVLELIEDDSAHQHFSDDATTLMRLLSKLGIDGVHVKPIVASFGIDDYLHLIFGGTIHCDPNTIKDHVRLIARDIQLR